MDAVTLALAKAYSDSKGGYAEPQKTILARTTLDFNKNAAYLPDPFNFVVGCEYKLTISLGGESESYTGVATEMTDNGIMVVTVVFGGIIACADFPPNVAEIYGAAASLAYMASGNVTVDPATEFEIVKPETIHPIDPKYLPGVVLPVVELSTTFKVGSQYTENENKILTALFEKYVPAVIKCAVDLGTIGVFEKTAFVWSPVSPGNMAIFVASVGGTILQIADMDRQGAWLCNAQ